MSLMLGSFLFKRVCLAIVPGLLLTAGISWLLWYAQPPTMHFETPEQFREFALEQGLFVHPSGRSATDNNFFVANRAIGFEQIERIGGRHECGETPEWKGIIWVVRLASERQEAPTGRYAFSVGGHVRIWGNVLAAGDLELLDHVEELYHRR